MRERAPVTIGCAVLAAGAGTRFGAPGEKLAAAIRGRPLAQHAIDAAAGSSATHCSLIVGAGADRVLSAVDLRRCAVYRNDDWESGVSSSIRLAVAIHADDDALAIVLADAPLVDASDLDALIDAWKRRPERPAALRSRGVWGSPAIFPRSAFGALGRLRGDRGAKGAVLVSGEVTLVDASSDAFVDVDRRADLKRLGARKRR
jgi:molybdenum cofactor cytidylyltransferase